MELRRTIRDGRHRLWWRLARRGHEDAFKRLYGELYGPVTGFVGARVQNNQDAEDLVSQVFHKFLEGLDRYEPQRGTVMSWVLTMARNAIIDHHRHQAAHGGARSQTVDVVELAEVLAADPVSGPQDVLATMIQTEETEHVRQWLSRQPSEVREMFALRYEQDLRLQEVARVMDLSESAIKQRFARATRQIRQELLTAKDTNPYPKGGPECLTSD